MITTNNVSTYFELENHRGKIKIKQRVQSIPENFRPYECCLRGRYLNISNNSWSIDSSQTRDINLEEWFNSQIDIENISNFIHLLELGELSISVDGLFFSDKSNLVSTHFIIMHNNRKISSGNFLLVVAFRYRYPFTAEICGVLTILKVIEYIINWINRRKEEYRIKITTDYSAIINFLNRRVNFISNQATLYQIKREILLIKEKLNLYIYPLKVKAHHDELVQFNKLTFLEKVNTICNKKAKILIQSETRETVLFLFPLSSPYLMVDRTVISQPEELERHLLIAIIRNYFRKRYNTQGAFLIIPTYLYTWVSKTLSNFTGIALRMK